MVLLLLVVLLLEGLPTLLCLLIVDLEVDLLRLQDLVRLDPLFGPVFRPRLMVLLLDLEPLFGPGFLPLLLNVPDLRVLEELLSTLFDLVRRTKDLVVEPAGSSSDSSSDPSCWRK